MLGYHAALMRSCAHVVALLCVASAMVLLGPDDAAAQAPPEIAAARQWFEEGLAFEEQGRWTEALESFRRAAQVKKTAQILFHQGLCEKHVGLLVEAALSLSRSASMARQDGLEAVERAANIELREVRERTPALHIVLTQGQRPEKVTLDGEQLSPVFLSQPVPVNPGEHVIVVFAGGKELRRIVSVAEGDVVKARFEALATQPSAAVSSTAAVSAPPDVPAGSPETSGRPTALDGASTESGNVLAWTLVGGGVLAIAGGSLFWSKRNEQLDRIDDICSSRDQCPPDRRGEIDDMESKGRIYSGLGLGLLGAGIASTATGVVLLIVDGANAEPLAILGPVFGPAHAGATLQGRF